MKKLKKLREDHNFTHAQMAGFLNISKSFYWQIENDKRKLSYDLAIKIAKIFNLQPDDLFYEECKSKI